MRRFRYLFVCFLVLGGLAFRWEPFAKDVTPERLFAGVGTNEDGEGALAREPLSAVLAFVGPGYGRARMYAEVCGEGGLVDLMF